MNLSAIINSGSLKYTELLTISAPVTLTVSQMGVIALKSTIATSITLPSATTLGNLRLLVLKNSGAFPLLIKDNAGTPLARLDPNTTLQLFATNISTSAGSWATDSTAIGPLWFGLDYTVYQPVNNTGATGILECVQVATNKLLFVYSKTSSSAGMIIGTIANGELTFGTEVTFLSGSALNQVSLVSTNTDAAVAVYNHGGGSGSAVVISVSGTVPSLGTPLTLTTGVGAMNTLVFSSTNKAVIGQASGASVLTVSGTTVSQGSVRSFGSSYLNFQLANIGTDKLMVMNYDGTLTANAASVMTITGSTVSLGAGATLHMGETASNDSFRLVSLNTDKAVAVYFHANGLKAFVLSASGTTVTQGSPQTFEQGLAALGTSAFFGARVATDQALVLVPTASGGLLTARLITASGTTLTSSGRVVYSIDMVTSGVSVAAAGGGSAAIVTNQVGTPQAIKARLGGAANLK